MKDAYEVLEQKEADLARVRQEIESLRIVVSLLVDDLNANDSDQTIAVPIRRGTDSPVLKPWNIAPPFRLGEKQVGTHQIGCVPWLLSRLTRPVALNFPIFCCPI